MALDLYLKAATVGQTFGASNGDDGRSRQGMELMERAGLEPATPSLQS